MKLFKYFFLSLDYYPIINNILLSESTKKNLIKIFEIFSQLISGELYKSEQESFYNTPFNLFLIENINIIFEIYQQLTFNNNLTNKDNNIYNKEKENDFFSFTVCFNMKIFETFMSIINENKNNLFQNDKHKKFEEIVNYFNKTMDINKTSNDKNKNIVNYFLFFDVMFKKEIMQKNFEKKNSKIENESMKNNINLNTNSAFMKKSKDKIKEKEKFEKMESKELILSKNILSEVLLNIDEIDINEINQKIKLTSLKEVLKLINNYFAEKNLNYNTTDTKISKIFEKEKIPIEWQINSLLNNLDKLGDYYTRNDYTNLFIYISNDINNSIKKYDFKLLAKIIEKLKYAKDFINYYKSFQKKYVELLINIKTKNFIEKEKIEVEINLEDNILNINSISDQLNEKESDKCLNINEFISKFPNLSLLSKNQDTELLLEENNMNLKKALDNYMSIIKKKLQKCFKENEIEIAFKKIKKYIMSKIYDKIFPLDSDNDDILFFCRTIKLSWVEPKHLKIPPNININNLIPVTNSFFNQLDNEKSPSSKMEIIVNIFNTINSLLRFNFGSNFSTDDIAPIFEYVLIKARPRRLSSNIKYLEFFMEKGSGLSDMYFDFLKNDLNYIIYIDYIKFNGITEKEFSQNCYEANKYYVE